MNPSRLACLEENVSRKQILNLRWNSIRYLRNRLKSFNLRLCGTCFRSFHFGHFKCFCNFDHLNLHSKSKTVKNNFYVNICQSIRIIICETMSKLEFRSNLAIIVMRFKCLLLVNDFFDFELVYNSLKCCLCICCPVVPV